MAAVTADRNFWGSAGGRAGSCRGRRGAGVPPVREGGWDGCVRGAAAAPPYRSAQFDAVICVDVLEHLEDDRAGLADIYRVLKPGGRVLVTVPAFQSLWSRRDVQLPPKRRYRR